VHWYTIGIIVSASGIQYSIKPGYHIRPEVTGVLLRWSIMRGRIRGPVGLWYNIVLLCLGH